MQKYGGFLPAPRLSACAKALADRRQAGLERGINADLLMSP